MSLSRCFCPRPNTPAAAAAEVLQVAVVFNDLLVLTGNGSHVPRCQPVWRAPRCGATVVQGSM